MTPKEIAEFAIEVFAECRGLFDDPSIGATRLNGDRAFELTKIALAAKLNEYPAPFDYGD